ncbi:MAG: lysostaphin resistance A-like protein [Verrucomicrobiales bacterium]
MKDPHPSRPGWNPILAFGLALGISIAGFFVTVPESVTQEYPWARQAVNQGLIAAVAVGAMALSGRPLAEFGFRRPRPANGRFLLWGLGLGVASTGIILVFRLRGMGGDVAAYGLPGIILWFWVISSTVEEVYCRGWFQTLIEGQGRVAVVWSAALFGAMHLPLLFGDMEIAAAMVILPSVTVLGYVCALARARTGSLIPALGAHVMFNVGGFLAGFIYVITYRVATGHMPSL